MRITFLGTSAAIPSAVRDTTALAVAAGKELHLIDAGGSPVGKLRQAGLDPMAITSVIVTHPHPDHAYGLPFLVHNLILLGRQRHLPIYCRPEHVPVLERLVDVFRLRQRVAAFPVEFVPVEPRELNTFLTTVTLQFTASPNAHGNMPNLAIRMDDPATGGAAVYSSDTEPSEAVIRLAKGAHILIHEATYAHADLPRAIGTHSSARQAGEVARAAGVRTLYLVHMEPAYHADPEVLALEARETFDGEVRVTGELQAIDL